MVKSTLTHASWKRKLVLLMMTGCMKLSTRTASMVCMRRVMKISTSVPNERDWSHQIFKRSHAKSTSVDYISHLAFKYTLNTSEWKIKKLKLTLNCIRYPALLLVHNGGFHGTPQRKPLSHLKFLIIFTQYVYTLITTIFQEKKYKIFLPFQNGSQITDFHFASFRFRPKFEKPLSQRNFSMKFGSN